MTELYFKPSKVVYMQRTVVIHGQYWSNPWVPSLDSQADVVTIAYRHIAACATEGCGSAPQPHWLAISLPQGLLSLLGTEQSVREMYAAISERMEQGLAPTGASWHLHVARGGRSHASRFHPLSSPPAPGSN